MSIYGLYYILRATANKREGRAFIRISSMFSVNKGWSDRVIYVELDELDSIFRESLPKSGVE